MPRCIRREIRTTTILHYLAYRKPSIGFRCSDNVIYDEKRLKNIDETKISGKSPLPFIVFTKKQQHQYRLNTN